MQGVGWGIGGRLVETGSGMFLRSDSTWPGCLMYTTGRWACYVNMKSCGKVRETGASHARVDAEHISSHPRLELPQERGPVWGNGGQHFWQKIMKSEVIQFRGLFKNKNVGWVGLYL